MGNTQLKCNAKEVKFSSAGPSWHKCLSLKYPCNGFPLVYSFNVKLTKYPFYVSCLMMDRILINWICLKMSEMWKLMLSCNWCTYTIIVSIFALHWALETVVCIYTSGLTWLFRSILMNKLIALCHQKSLDTLSL